jgi:predicted pyridoxine 5'-phosphate oxidase superfamily flavin-nucleotide-binding protein
MATDDQRTFPSDVAFTASVKIEQEKRGSRKGYQKMEERGGWRTTVDDDLQAFIDTRESFYLGTVNADGYPYIQHRGGKAGFLKVLDENRLAFTDFAGNKQYITLGKLNDNPKAFIFLMDYRNRRRIKIWGHATYVEDDEALMERLIDQDYNARPERAVLFTIEAWDSNCPQHIPQMWSEAEIAPVVNAMNARIEELEAEISALKAQSES